MPAFSKAISARVDPSNAQWSRPMDVTTDSTGVMMFVLSRRPPRPTSITAASTPRRANHQKAMPVVISKKDSPSKSFSYKFRNSQTSSRVIISNPPSDIIFILSRKSRRWGDVYSPTCLPDATASPQAIRDGQRAGSVPLKRWPGYRHCPSACIRPPHPVANAEASMLQTLPLPLVPAT